jgi:hypothetical protein
VSSRGSTPASCGGRRAPGLQPWTRSPPRSGSPSRSPARSRSSPAPTTRTRRAARRPTAVASLVDAFGGVPDEATAVRISLLVQARDATAALAEAAIAQAGDGRADDVVAAVVRDDPPVRATRRVIAGALVTLDLTRARDAHLPFGSGPRRCPGREHALALAAGALEAHRDGVL